ncbi:sodium:calcium antiporter [Geminicoccus roseus]|uniref:sodium:calcium antiporter n=1 Tax=Geminicoccus roseus TaxID=404900 RepID=UPI000427D3D6|nr:sodium:calcium antiporter [Geminicoccus roseus]
MGFENFAIWLNLLIFAASGAFVWAAGTRLAVYVDGIAEKTGVGQAFIGMLLLGGITSLPEIATVTTASWTGNAPLAVNNLLGSASSNILLLAVADAVLGRDALTSVVAKPSTLLQGTLGILLLAGVAMVVVSGDWPVFGIGIGAWALLFLCVASLWLSSGYERRHVWEVVGDQEPPPAKSPGRPDTSLQGLVWRTALAALVILVAGFFLAQTGDAIAVQSGLGAGLVGLVLVGFATSLPELSSIIAALRIRRYEMAVGDIFGTNLFNIALIFLADLVYQGEPVLGMAGRFEAVAALLALILTGLFVLGLLERKDKTVMRMGYDALAAIVFFVVGLVVLFFLDGQ